MGVGPESSRHYTCERIANNHYIMEVMRMSWCFIAAIRLLLKGDLTSLFQEMIPPLVYIISTLFIILGIPFTLVYRILLF